jgi:cytochrome c553
MDCPARNRRIAVRLARNAAYRTRFGEHIAQGLPIVPPRSQFLRAQPHPKPTTNRMNKSGTFFAVAGAAAALAVSALAANVTANWQEHCAKCHGEDGKGQTKMGKKLGIADLTDAKVQAKFTDDAAFKAIKDGLKDKDGKVQMKPIENVGDADIKALVAHVRALKK